MPMLRPLGVVSLAYNAAITAADLVAYGLMEPAPTTAPPSGVVWEGTDITWEDLGIVHEDE